MAKMQSTSSTSTITARTPQYTAHSWLNGYATRDRWNEESSATTEIASHGLRQPLLRQENEPSTRRPNEPSTLLRNTSSVRQQHGSSLRGSGDSHVSEQTPSPRRNSMQLGDPRPQAVTRPIATDSREIFEGSAQIVPEGWIPHIDPYSGETYLDYAPTGASQWTPTHASNTAHDGSNSSERRPRHNAGLNIPDRMDRGSSDSLPAKAKQKDKHESPHPSTPIQRPKAKQPRMVTIAVLGATPVETQSFMSSLNVHRTPPEIDSQYGQSFLPDKMS